MIDRVTWADLAIAAAAIAFLWGVWLAIGWLMGWL